MLDFWHRLSVIQFSIGDNPLLLSVLVVGGLLLGGWFAWTLSQRVKQRTHPRVAHVFFVGILIILLGIAGSTLLTAWNAGGQAITLLQPLSGLLTVSVRISLSVAVLVLAYIGTGIVNRVLEQHIEQNNRLSQHQSEVAFRVSALGVYAVGLIAVLGFWNIDVRGLLISAGFLGIVVGMAARQTLGSLLAGFVLMFSRPFEIGDWIEIQNEQGIVTEITIFTTRIQKFDGKYVMIPNDIVAGNKVTNLRRRGRLRIEVEIGVDYDTDPERAMELAERTMQDCSEVVATPRPQAVLKGFSRHYWTLVLD